MNIPQYAPTMSELDINSVCDYMRSGGFITEYKLSRKFEDHLSNIADQFAVLFPNGTLTMFAI